MQYSSEHFHGTGKQQKAFPKKGVLFKVKNQWWTILESVLLRFLQVLGE